MPTTHVGALVHVRAGEGRLTVSRLGATIAEHAIVAPGETSILDEHYGGARPKPRRALRPQTPDEVAFSALGPLAETFIKGAAAAGMTTLKGDLAVLLRLERSHGRDALLGALARAIEFGRWRASDVSSILAAGSGVARPTGAGMTLVTQLPTVTSRPLDDYRVEASS